MNKEAYIERMKKIPLFQEIKDNDEAIETLFKICRPKHYDADYYVITEGEVGASMFIIIDGEVEVRKSTTAGDVFTVVTLKAEHNVYFGEVALVADETRTASVVTTCKSEFLLIEKTDFLKLGNNMPHIGLIITRAIAQSLCGRLKKTTTDMLTLYDALVKEIQE